MSNDVGVRRASDYFDAFRTPAPPVSTQSNRSSVRAQAVVTGKAGGALFATDSGAVLGARRHAGRLNRRAERDAQWLFHL